jgi:hypothetical protein
MRLLHGEIDSSICENTFLEQWHLLQSYSTSMKLYNEPSQAGASICCLETALAGHVEMTFSPMKLFSLAPILQIYQRRNRHFAP